MTNSVTTPLSIDQTDTWSSPSLRTPAFRPRFARFDRPAIDLDEMMRADGEDFVHIAYWSIIGRRASQSEHTDWTMKWTGDGSKYALLEHFLIIAGPDGPANDYPGLKHMLRSRRNARLPLIGPALIILIGFGARHSSLVRPVGFIQSLPEKMRRTYRKSRNMLFQLGATLNLPSWTRMRRTLHVRHAPPPTGTSARAAQIYEQLCSAINSTRRQS